MIDFFENLLSGAGFVPRWHCGLWTQFHGLVDQAACLVIFVAYLFIPAALAFLAYRRRDDFPFLFDLVNKFGLFILWCGLTHLSDIAVFYWPAYRLFTLVKVISAVYSVRALWSFALLYPKLLTMQGPNDFNKQLEDLKLLERKLRHQNRGLQHQLRLRADCLQVLATTQALESASGNPEQVKEALSRLDAVTEVLRRDIANIQGAPGTQAALVMPLALAPVVPIVPTAHG